MQKEKEETCPGVTGGTWTRADTDPGYVSGLQSLVELIRFATSEMLLDGSFEVGC